MPILTLRKSIANKLREELRGVDVEEHPRAGFSTEDLDTALKNRTLALRVAFSGVLDDAEWSSGEVDTPTSWTVYVATKDMANNPTRDQIALAVIPKILAAVAGGQFEMPRPTLETIGEDEDDGCERETLHRVTKLRATPLYDGEVDTKSAMVWGVSWSQVMSIPPEDCNDIRPLITLITRYDLHEADGAIDATDTISMRTT